MNQVLLQYDRLPDQSVFDLLNRDAALWLCATNDEIVANLDAYSALIELPWSMVLIESTSSELRNALESRSSVGALTASRGFIHVVATDPSKIIFPRRALPVFFLNGVENASEAKERDTLTGIASTRRRLNVYKELITISPSRLVIVGSNLNPIVSDIGDLWSEEYRSRIDLVSQEESELESAKDVFQELGGLPVVTFVRQKTAEFAEDVVQRAKILLPSTAVRIRLVTDEKNVEELDIANAELPEHPLLDRYRLIRSDDLVRITPEDLTTADIAGFFDKSKQSWKPFGAGLPWMQDRSVVTDLVSDLRTLRRRGADANCVRYIWSEPGAGGTTLAMSLAYEAAQSGYPTLLANESLGTPNALEVASFLYRVRQTQEERMQTADLHEKNNRETPWLIVFEETHWEGREAELKSFLAELGKSGRPVVLLLVLQNYLHPDIENIPGTKCIAEVRHELSKQDAIALGRHLNQFLKHLGKSKSESEWISFWEQHKPNIDIDSASFWIALEFWLKGLIDLGESIQSWLWRKFTEAGLSAGLVHIVMQIASFAIQRRAVPEALLRRPEEESLPISVLLDNIRYSVPAIGLMRSNKDGVKSWSIAHDILARYLVTSAFFDRKFTAENLLADKSSLVDFRLYLIGEIARHPAMGEEQFRSFATDLAVNILKLDVGTNQEFFQYWREVISILEHAPKSILKSSRAFNHHVAISRRRVATNIEFDATQSEKKEQLEKAVEQLLFALRSLDDDSADDSDLNLLNTLALTYQNLAELAVQIGEPLSYISELRKKAGDITREALALDPSSPFVLETAARNLIQHGRIERADSVAAAAESLSYIFQALTLDRSAYRQNQLTRLMKSALELLTAPGGEETINQLCARNEPYGFLARAWLLLTDDLREGEPLEAATIRNSQEALDVLRAAPVKNWLILHLQYDLTVKVAPTDFAAQLVLLDELSGTDYRMPPQIRLEQAILLHQTGRHVEANEKFAGLRADLKQHATAVAVPDRLRWLLASDRVTRQTFDAEALDDLGFRSMAKVRALSNAKVPFIPQDFGSRKILPRTHFRCYVTFGSMGPFLRPATNAE